MTELTRERLKEVLHYDPDTGIFTYVDHYRKSLNGKEAGHTLPDGSMTIKVDGKNYRAARLAWLYFYGGWPILPQIDHIDGIPWNNRIENLRQATASTNQCNTTLHPRSQSGRKGVHWAKGKWRAQITINGKLLYLGLFENIEVAAHVYNKAAVRHHGEFAVLNPVGWKD